MKRSSFTSDSVRFSVFMVFVLVTFLVSQIPRIAQELFSQILRFLFNVCQDGGEQARWS
jgi:hypothetical protein